MPSTYKHEQMIDALKPWVRLLVIAISTTWFVSITFPTLSAMREAIANRVDPIQADLQEIKATLKEEREERKENGRLILEIYRSTSRLKHF
jgi:hypothetical protein